MTNNKWHKENNELFADLTDILNASKPISPFNTIQKSYKTYVYFDESHLLSPLSNISNSVKDEKYPKKDNVTPEEQPKK